MKQSWPLFKALTTLFWGLWGFFLDLPARYGVFLMVVGDSSANASGALE